MSKIKVKVTNKKKVDMFVLWYKTELCKIDIDYAEDEDILVLNQVIIDSIGLSGLEQVKNLAWKKTNIKLGI